MGDEGSPDRGEGRSSFGIGPESHRYIPSLASHRRDRSERNQNRRIDAIDCSDEHPEDSDRENREVPLDTFFLLYISRR